MSDPTYYPKTPLPDWAENDDYPAGVDPWSGAPTKIEPVGAERDPGIQPDDQLGAQQYNWLNHAYGRLTKVSAHQPMQTWQAFSVALETNSGPGAYYGNLSEDSRAEFIAAFRPMLGDGLFRPQRPFIAAFSLAAEGRASAYGYHWTDLAAHPDPALVHDAYGTSTGKVLVSLAADDRAWVLTQFGTWVGAATGATAADGGTLDGHVYHQAQDRLLLSFAGGIHGSALRIAVSDDDGATWTLKSLGSADYSVYRMADDGADTIVAIVLDNSDASVLHFLRSIDNGDNWSLVNTIGSGETAGIGGLAYSPVWKQFMFVSHENGAVLTSEDGASWTARTGLPISVPGILDTIGDGPGDVSGAVRVLACIGSVFATTTTLFINGADGIVEKVGGVLYSFDCGTTWHFVPLSHLTSLTLKPIRGIIAAGGQFLVNAQGVIFASGQVWVPPEDLTVT